MDDVAIQLSGVSKSYSGFELEDVSLQLPRGYIMGLVGPNGAGKTTIIRIMMNLAQANSGQVTIFGLDNVAHEAEVKRRIGLNYSSWMSPRLVWIRWFGESFLRSCWISWATANGRSCFLHT